VISRESISLILRRYVSLSGDGVDAFFRKVIPDRIEQYVARNSFMSGNTAYSWRDRNVFLL